jgi:hypothetical protein
LPHVNPVATKIMWAQTPFLLLRAHYCVKIAFLSLCALIPRLQPTNRIPIYALIKRADENLTCLN